MKTKKISEKQRLRDLEVMNRITSKSRFTKRDIDKLSNKIKKAAAKRFFEISKKEK